jgi:DNA adenine methylase
VPRPAADLGLTRIGARRAPVARGPAQRRSQAIAEPVSPIVKWAGGKTKLLSELLTRVPARRGRYFEPFLGGGALFFRLAPRRALLADRNQDLIHMYRCVASEVDEVIRCLAQHKRRHCDEYYYEMREQWNRGIGCRVDVSRAASFIYLNKTCYNGLWRVNRRGHFNVPVGRYTAPQIYDAEQLRRASRLLAGAELRAQHFADAVAEARAGDLVYFDPPYHPVTATANFTSYTSEDFGDEAQRELAQVVRDLDRRGCTVLVSNSDTPFIHELYRGMRLDRVHCARAINSKASARGLVSELIISNR